MAAVYRLGFWRRLANFIVRGLLAVGLGPRFTCMLVVRGRTSGRLYSTPVQEGSERWLVAPYGDVAWVKNARAARRVTLRRGGRSEDVQLAELGPAESASVLKHYVTRIPITRPYFDVTPDSDLAAFAAEAPRHPVFRLVSLSPPGRGTG
jgi:F420H(2)-dependent quinone reductase